MVDKDFFEAVEEQIGRSIHPYDADSPLSHDEAREEYNGLMEGGQLWEGFNSSDKIIYHSTPDYEEERARFGLLEAVALDLDEKNRDPQIHLNRDYKGRVLSSDTIEEEDVSYHDAETLEDEIRDPFDMSVEGRTIHITADYEADKVYRFREDFDDSEFIVLSADTSEIDSVPGPMEYLLTRIRESRETPDWS